MGRDCSQIFQKTHKGGCAMMSGSTSRESGVSCILVVEDNDQLRKTLCEVLAENLSGVAVVAASSCEEAVARIFRSVPDVIITDIHLPGKSGLVLTEKVKAQYPCLPVIIHTQYTLPEYREAAEALGADLFLVKGKIQLNRLCRLIGGFLD
ncbi:response regulator [Desulfococcus multivorans]|nr:response regulator [Desulfococcus multivorans]AQV00890.2 hypothetical protein B2D07_08975 [Desulfococcus multivorans]